MRAVLFDLDDTLYPQSAWLDGAWAEVGAAAARWHVDPPLLHRALISAAAARGSAGGRIIDHALAGIGASHVPVEPLVAAFRAHRPAALAPYPGVGELLGRLRASLRVGLVTDGDASIQESKLHALGLHDCFDVVVYSDRLGRHRRKPHPAPFRDALGALGVSAMETLFVGDHPEKDVAGPQALGMRAIRVRSGEYAGMAGERPWATVATVAEAGAFVLDAAAR